MKITESLLWKYIEGNCTKAEQIAVEQTFETDTKLKKEWLERKILHQMMNKQELETPSMRFSKNVMESLPKLYDYSISRKQLRPFFIVALGVSLMAIVVAVLFTSSNVPSESVSLGKWLPDSSMMSNLLLQDQLLFVGLAMGAITILLIADQWVQKSLKIN